MRHWAKYLENIELARSLQFKEETGKLTDNYKNVVNVILEEGPV